MELKKNPQFDLSRYRTIFLEIGLILSLLIVWVGFEWKFYDALPQVQLSGENEALNVEQIDIPITEHTPPPPPKTVLEQPEIIEIENEEEILDEVEANLDVEMDVNKTLGRSIIGEGYNEKPKEVFVAPPPVEEEEDEIFLVVEEDATPEGGMKGFMQFIADNLKYPRAAIRNDQQGSVFVQFVINKDGKLSDFEVVRGIGFGCDEEALRVMRMAPKWKPGKQRGRPVRVKKVVPIRFILMRGAS